MGPVIELSRRHTGPNFEGSYGLVDHRTCSNDRALSNPNALQNDDIGPEPNILFKDDWRLDAINLLTNWNGTRREAVVVINKIASGRNEAVRPNFEPCPDVELTSDTDKDVVTENEKRPRSVYAVKLEVAAVF